ncbi:MAG: hypothetical protein WCA30_12470 [Dermatophilaceae bacterium]
MTVDVVERFLAEYRQLPLSGEATQDALRWAILVEDVLGVTLSDEEITSGPLTDPERLRAAVAGSSPPG